MFTPFSSNLIKTAVHLLWCPTRLRDIDIKAGENMMLGYSIWRGNSHVSSGNAIEGSQDGCDESGVCARKYQIGLRERNSAVFSSSTLLKAPSVDRIMPVATLIMFPD